MSAVCRAPGVSRQGCCQRASRPESAHDARDHREPEGAIGEEYEASRGIYGAPKVREMLRRRGVRTSRKRVARIMPRDGWRGATRACARRASGEERASKAESAEGLVGRDFAADGPNRAWFGDITYVRTRQGWLYLAVVTGVWSRMAVGWSMGPRITAGLADDALGVAMARRRPPAGCIHHSDRGAQYVSLLPGRTMRDAGTRPSMGSISSPWDNAATESLVGAIKSECVHARTFDSRERAALEIFDYIEGFYNGLRIHSALGWLSPAEFGERVSEASRSEAA